MNPLQVRYNFAKGNLTLVMPPPYSTIIQVSNISWFLYGIMLFAMLMWNHNARHLLDIFLLHVLLCRSVRQDHGMCHWMINAMMRNCGLGFVLQDMSHTKPRAKLI